MSCTNKDIVLEINGKKVTEGDNMPLSKCRTIKHGVTINVKSTKNNEQMMMEEKKGPSDFGKKKEDTKDTKKDEPINRCKHGPNGMCIYCVNKTSDVFSGT